MIKENFKIFTIRDHSWQGRELSGGQTGFKNFSIPTIESNYDTFVRRGSNIDRYQSDQDFIKEYIFDKYKQDIIAYSEYSNFGEGLNMHISLPRKSIEDFCGNVYLFDDKDTEYTEFTIYGKK